MKNIQIYKQQTIALVDSLIIKSETVARAMNQPLHEMGVPVPSNKREWRYYLHLYGEYHHIDTEVKLLSLDTGVEVVLSKSLLEDHKKTSNIYRFTPEYVTRLVDKYPTMAVFIEGVFNPIEPDDAIDAIDCTIMSHDKRYVESQEVSLIPMLSNYIRSVQKSMFYEGFETSNDAYTTAFWINVFASLPGRIMLLRSQKTHTQETHSFHIETFLASHQHIDEFIPYLTLKQKLYLYRNIRYIERNVGKEETLQTLVHVLLTGWNMPTSAYDVGQKIHSIDKGDLHPLPIVYERPMNFTEDLDGRDAITLDTRALIEKEYSLAYDNPNNLDEYLTDLDGRLKLTQYPQQPSKVIEITAVDPAELEPYRIEEILVNEWLHVATLGLYDVYHEILNPLNGDTIRLNTKELYVLFIYAAYKGFSGFADVNIPEFIASGVQLKRWVQKPEYLKYLPSSWDGRWDGLIDHYTDTHHEIYNKIVTPNEFYTNATAILKAKQARHRYGYNYERTEERLASRMLFNYNYMDLTCDLGIPEKTYSDFFERFGIRYNEISDEVWQDIAVDALNIATGYENNTEISHKDIQNAMVKLLTRLSSYTVHFASRMATDSPIVTEPLLATIGSITCETGSMSVLDTPSTTVVDHRTESHGYVNTPPILCDILSHDVPITIVALFDHTVGITADVFRELSFIVDTPSTDIVRSTT